MIGLEDMVEALGRFCDFVKVQTGEFDGEPFKRRLDAGESVENVVADLFAEIDRPAIVAALRNQREALGLSDEALRAFWLALPAVLNADPGDTDDMSHPAYVGLVVGLLAQQCEAEREGDHSSR